MEVIITEQNINQYKSSTFPEIEEIRWKLKYLDSKVLSNFPNLKKLDCSNNGLTSLQKLTNLRQLRVLYCSYNQLTNLQGIDNLTQLQVLHCSSNKLINLQGLTNLTQLQVLRCSGNKLTTLQELTNLTQLREFYCSGNKLTTLQELANLAQLQVLNCSSNKLTNLRGLENLTQLQDLDFSHNKLTNLQGLVNLAQLRTLDCSDNRLTTLQELTNLTQLQIFYCYHNKLTSLQELDNFIQLQKLDCSYNQITTLQGLTNLTQLQIIDCSYNQITNFRPIVYLTRLQNLYCFGNFFNPPTIQEERFLQRLQNRRISQTIYNDRQNVHNTTIQKAITQSTSNLLKDPKPPKPNISSLSTQSQTLLQTYFQDTTPHSILLITYEELFSYVWARIQQSPHKDTLIQILEQELKDSTDLCYTGRFNRTINTLNGFYDDIEVQISDPDRINAIIHQHKDKDSIIQALQEAGYDPQTIEAWTTDL